MDGCSGDRVILWLPIGPGGPGFVKIDLKGLEL